MKSIYDMFRHHQPGPITDLSQAFKDLGMDFPVVMRKKYFKKRDGSEEMIRNSMVIIRDDTEQELGEASDVYGLVAYPHSFAFIAPMLKEARIELMGGHLTGVGERAYLALKSPDDTIVLSGPNDKIENYFLLKSSHDGSGSIEVNLFPYRALNGTAFVPSETSVISFRHSRKVEDRLAQAQKTIETIRQEWKQFSEDVILMSSVSIDDAGLDNYFKCVLDMKPGAESKRSMNVKDQLTEIFKTSGICSKLPGTKGTVFGALQAVNEWVDFHRTVRKSKFYDEVSARVETLVAGSGAKQKAKAYAIALGMIQKMRGF